MRSSTLSRVLGILVVAVLVGGLIGWLASRSPSRSSISAEKTDEGVSTSTTSNEPAARAASRPAMERKRLEVQTQPVPAPAPNATEVVLDDPTLWEEKLDEILGSDTPEAEKGDQLLAMMPKVGEEAQVELAGHIINLVDDSQFHKAAMYLTNAQVPEAISTVFMNDLYNRDETVKLPLLLDIARNDKHALRDEAKDLLELYVEEDHGTNWGEWEAATKKFLAEHEAQ